MRRALRLPAAPGVPHPAPRPASPAGVVGGAPRRRAARPVGALLGALLGATAVGAPLGAPLAAQATAAVPYLRVPNLPAARLPFFAGEELTYRVQVARVGAAGRATMRIAADPVAVRGTDTWHLRFDFGARLGLVKAEDRTESWLDPRRLAALRFAKRERHVLARHDERVELLPEERRWSDDAGAEGTTPTDAPLDELSFMYVLRTLPLEDGAVVRLERHYDPARNPTTVRVVGRRTLTTGAGTFRTVQLEMRVRDPRHYKGDGVLRLDLSDDHCRLPIRIESTMPIVGTAVMTLEAQNHPVEHHLARAGG